MKVPTKVPSGVETAGTVKRDTGDRKSKTQDVVMSGEALTTWRRSRGFTPSELAALLPISLRVLQNWESGRTSIPSYLPRALRDVEREPLSLERRKFRYITPEESRVLIGQVITGYSCNFEQYERLHLQNGWALVLSGVQTGGRWFVENYQAILDEKVRRGEVTVIRRGCDAIRPKFAIAAAKIRAKLKLEGKPDPTAEDILQESSLTMSFNTEETLQFQRYLFKDLDQITEKDPEGEQLSQDKGCQKTDDKVGRTERSKRSASVSRSELSDVEGNHE